MIKFSTVVLKNLDGIQLQEPMSKDISNLRPSSLSVLGEATWRFSARGWTTFLFLSAMLFGQGSYVLNLLYIDLSRELNGQLCYSLDLAAVRGIQKPDQGLAAGDKWLSMVITIPHHRSDSDN